MAYKNPQQDELFSLPERSEQQGPVECLGMTFDNDEARRAYFIEQLRAKLQDPEFRKIDGFPIGEDEDILRLSDPPYFTACPNPFTSQFATQNAKPIIEEDHPIEAYASDIQGSKSTGLYMAHTYSTKVPPESIVPMIEHYTKPEELILDPFCGSGMLGVAIHMLNGNKSPAEHRRAIISDLSPFAGFLSHKMTHSINANNFQKALNEILRELRKEIGWIYKRSDGKDINYAIWSDVWICPNCGNTTNDWDLTVDEDSLTIKLPVCNHCQLELKRGSLERKKITFYDPVLGKLREQSIQVITRLGVISGGRTILVKPDEHDISLIEKCKDRLDPTLVPRDELPKGYNTEQPLSSHGFIYTHDFYTWRNLLFITNFLALAKKSNNYEELLFALTSVIVKTASKLHAIGFGGGINLAGQSPNTLQIPSSLAERNLFNLLENKSKSLEVVYSYTKTKENVFVSVESAQKLRFIPDDSIDYIFTDPPFGSNINYSEVNFIYESWLGVKTNQKTETIVNKAQHKGIFDYEVLMTRALKECFRVLKPGRWITVEFHNSQNAIWNAIQNAIGNAGFVIADVRVFNKGQSTWKQMTTTTAVKQDLMIAAYKPNMNLVENFKLEDKGSAGVWQFIHNHLKYLPTFVQNKDGALEVVQERMRHLLFDRMVAFHVQRGLVVPISSAEFYIGLDQRFPQRDGMYFLSEQVTEYDKMRMTALQIQQLKLFVNDESSAILWLRQQLDQEPQTYQEIHPKYIKELRSWQKFEKPLELSELLEQNFLRYDGNGPIPQQIWNWLMVSSASGESLSSSMREEPPASLRKEAKDRWYVPDANNARDLELLRERALLKEFEEYQAFQGRILKVFRLEAVRAGFKRAWQEKDYQTIIQVAQKIPEEVLQEDPKLLMWYDQALTRTSD